MDKWITQAEFARRVGVTANTVQRGIDNGRIKKDPVTKKVNWTTEESQWYANVDPSQQRADKDPYGRRQNQSKKISTDDSGEFEDYNSAKTKRAIYEAKLKKIEYEKTIGSLIEKDVIKDASFKFGKQIRDAVLTIPERVGAVYAAQVSSEFESLLREKFPKIATEVLQLIDQKKLEQISRNVWNTESRSVLEEIEKGIKV